MAPETPERFRLQWRGNGFDGEVSNEAAGIIVTLFALSHLSHSHVEGDHLPDQYAKLWNHAGEHPEAGSIFSAID